MSMEVVGKWTRMGWGWTYAVSWKKGPLIPPHIAEFLMLIFTLKKSRSFKPWCWRWGLGKDKMGETEFFCLLPCDLRSYLRSSLENLIPIIICLVTFTILVESSHFWACTFFQVSLRGHWSVTLCHAQVSYYIFWHEENWKKINLFPQSTETVR